MTIGIRTLFLILLPLLIAALSTMWVRQVDTFCIGYAWESQTTPVVWTSRGRDWTAIWNSPEAENALRHSWDGQK